MAVPLGGGPAAGPLVPTLARLVAQADALHRAGQLPRARRAWEDLVQRAQERADRGTETAARAMLARCLLHLRDLDGARDQLEIAARAGVGGDPEARVRGTEARLRLEEGPAEQAHEALVQYARWAEGSGRAAPVLDVCLLTVRVLPPEARAVWLERGLDRVQQLGEPPSADLARVGVELAAALDQLGEADRALAAYQQAHRWHDAAPDAAPRDGVATGWAIGALAVRLEDWPLARAALERAIDAGAAAADCDDLVALAHHDLALVYEAAGDVIEARRLLLKAIARGREQQLGAVWPERWTRLREDAHRLELELD